MKETLKEKEKKVIFFDGICGLCNSSVDFIIQRDIKNTFYFSALQSEYAKKTLPTEITENLDTLIFLEDGKIYRRSRAVFKILSYIEVGFWSKLTVFEVFPVVLMDLVYKLVSKYRYKIFGKRKVCRFPSSDELKKFLV